MVAPVRPGRASASASDRARSPTPASRGVLLRAVCCVHTRACPNAIGSLRAAAAPRAHRAHGGCCAIYAGGDGATRCLAWRSPRRPVCRSASAAATARHSRATPNHQRPGPPARSRPTSTFISRHTLVLCRQSNHDSRVAVGASHCAPAAGLGGGAARPTHRPGATVAGPAGPGRRFRRRQTRPRYTGHVQCRHVPWDFAPGTARPRRPPPP